jgi:hypothetical protein
MVFRNLRIHLLKGRVRGLQVNNTAWGASLSSSLHIPPHEADILELFHTHTLAHYRLLMSAIELLRLQDFLYVDKKRESA